MALNPVIHATQVLSDLAATKLIDLRNQSVEELTVVRDNDSGTVEGFDSLFEHVLRCHIEVVGGLVEDKQVDGFQQQANHSQTTALATAEHLDFLVGSLATKHESTQYVVDAQADIALGYVVDGLEHGEFLVQQLCLVLGEIAYLDVMAHLQVSIKRYLTHDTLHQRRLTLTVLTHKGHLLATLDGEVDIREDGMGTIVLADILADDGIVA